MNIEEHLDPLGLNPRTDDEPDLEGQFVRQKNAALAAVGTFEVAAIFLLAYRTGDTVDEEIVDAARQQVKFQIAHLERYVKLPQNPKLPVGHRRLGSRIDRALLHGHVLMGKAIEVYELPGKLRDIRERAAEHERRRRERIEERGRLRARYIVPAVDARSSSPVPKREKLEPKPRCTKCGKRPPVTGGLCDPCARWEFGR